MFAIGNKELAEKPLVKKGQFITCPQCKKKHRLAAGKSRAAGEKNWKVSTNVLWYKCNGQVYMGALAGRLLF
jgi:hypothetical protein